MGNDRNITEEAFNKFLCWLHPDREEAGREYEKIRRCLIIMLTYQHCAEAEDLADEAINRVIRQLPKMIDTYTGEPIPYFKTVLRNLYREYIKEHRTRSELPLDVPQPPDRDPEEGRAEECLELCMKGLPLRSRALVIEYYQEDKQAKIDHRKILASKMGIEINALRIRTHRIRATLEQCIDKCLAGGPAHEMNCD